MTTACVVAVVVAYHPNPSQLAQLLAALAPQVAHTVCVDNTNGLPPATRQPDAHTTHLQLGRNTGIAHAQNLGLAQARQLGATHVLLMDQDSQPPPDLVAQLLAGWRHADTSASEAHRAHQTNPSGQASQSRRPDPASDTDDIDDSGPRLAAIGPLCRDEKTGRLMPLIQRQGWRIRRSVPDAPTASLAPIQVEYIPASGTLLSLAALDRVGPLQADYFIDRVDVQWCLRARQLGLAVCVNPAVEMAHNQATRSVRLLGRTLYVGHDFRAYFHVRNSLAMALDARVPAFWRVDQLLKLPAYLALHIAVAQHGRWRMVGWMAAALRDALRGRMGLGHFSDRPLR